MIWIKRDLLSTFSVDVPVLSEAVVAWLLRARMARDSHCICLMTREPTSNDQSIEGCDSWTCRTDGTDGTDGSDGSVTSGIRRCTGWG